MLFIINPKSGTRDKQRIARMAQQELSDMFDVRIQYTEYAGHATEIAREAAKNGENIVVAVGGDGTVNEVGRGLIHTNTAMGIIPCGSGNGLARDLHIPMIPIKAIRRLRNASERVIDYGIMNGETFFCTCGVGYDAYIGKEFASAGSRGFITYIKKVLASFATYKPEKYHIRTDEAEFEQEAFVVTCGNATQFGNNGFITPDADMADGMLDVTVLSRFPLVASLPLAIELFTKQLNHSHFVTSLRTKNISIRRQSPGCVHFDGEPFEMGEEINIHIVPQGLKVYC